MTKKNLWGDLGKFEEVRTPASILREQADLLVELTGFTLQGVVTREASRDRFKIGLNIQAPGLGDYQFQVLEINHGLEIYPLEVADFANQKEYRCDEEGSFEEALGLILSSPRVKHIISMLVSQSKA